MARNIQLFIDHSEFDLQIHDEIRHISVPVLGRFNISNVLAVITSLLALEMPMSQVIESIGYIQGVDGRMELLKHSQPFHAVSYTHLLYQELIKKLLISKLKNQMMPCFKKK